MQYFRPKEGDECNTSALQGGTKAILPGDERLGGGRVLTSLDYWSARKLIVIVHRELEVD